MRFGCIESGIGAPRFVSLYRDLLGPTYDALHPHVRLAHEAPLRATGTLDVFHGSHRLGAVLVRLMHLPDAGSSRPVVLTLSAPPGPRTPSTLHWSRQIGTTRLETQQFARGGLLAEQHGAGRITFVLTVADGALVYEQAAFHVLGIPVGAAIAPSVHARVSPAVDGWSVDVNVHWRGHLVCRYAGRMQPGAAS